MPPAADAAAAAVAGRPARIADLISAAVGTAPPCLGDESPPAESVRPEDRSAEGSGPALLWRRGLGLAKADASVNLTDLARPPEPD
jgi:hypothetical protein